MLELQRFCGGKWWRRRFLLSVKMMAIIIPALSVNDCGYYFGMRVVGKMLGVCGGFGSNIACIVSCVMERLGCPQSTKWKGRLV
eukprot:6295104-Amphidinium_carterae.1